MRNFVQITRMKIITSLCFLLLVAGVQAQKSKVSLEINFTGIEQGYDHTTKYEVYIDDALITTSPEQKESETYSTKFKIKRGEHTLKIVNLTLYEGTWEVTSIANNYTLDGTIEKKLAFGKKAYIDILYDLDNPPVPSLTLLAKKKK